MTMPNQCSTAASSDQAIACSDNNNNNNNNDAGAPSSDSAATIFRSRVQQDESSLPAGKGDGCTTTTLESQNLPTRGFYKVILVGGGFTFLSGWADTMSLIHFHTFAAMVTGDVIFLGVSLAPDSYRKIAGESNHPFWYYVMVIASNIFGAFCTSLILRLVNKEQTEELLPVIQIAEDVKASQEQQRSVLRVYWQCIVTFLSMRMGYFTGCFCLTMMLIGSLTFHLSPGMRNYSIVFFAAAFGAQTFFTNNSKELENIPTTVMTLHAHKFAVLAASLFNRKKKLDWADGATHKLILPMFAAIFMLLGAMFGGILMRLGSHIFPISMLLISVLQLLLFILHDELLVVRS